jgi:hypothetical protein
MKDFRNNRSRGHQWQGESGECLNTPTMPRIASIEQGENRPRINQTAGGHSARRVAPESPVASPRNCTGESAGAPRSTWTPPRAGALVPPARRRRIGSRPASHSRSDPTSGPTIGWRRAPLVPAGSWSRSRRASYRLRSSPLHHIVAQPRCASNANQAHRGFNVRDQPAPRLLARLL